MRILLQVALVVALGLFSTSTTNAGALDNQLRSVMPSSDYSLLLTSKYRRFVSESPIDGFVQILGASQGDDVVVRQVLSAQPSSVDVKTAKSLVKRVKVPGGATGSRMSPNINVYVLFYNQEKASRLALLYAVPGDSFGHVVGAKNFFVEIVEYQVDPKANTSPKQPAAAAKN